MTLRSFHLAALLLIVCNANTRAASLPDEARESLKPRISKFNLRADTTFALPVSLDLSRMRQLWVDKLQSLKLNIGTRRENKIFLQEPRKKLSAFGSLTGLSALVNHASPQLVRGAPDDPVRAYFDAAGKRFNETPVEPEFTPEERSAIQAYERVIPSTVFITNLARKNNDSIHSESQTVLREPIYDVNGYGSGFVWDHDGHIVTNCHVVHRGDAIFVRFHDASEREAKVVGQDPWNDIAVLKVTAPIDRLQPVERGDSTRLRVGQTAMALGAPLGMVGSLTRGIVSALERDITGMSGRPIRGLIQTDASINPGNSGCPLLDRVGRVIGMVTMTYVSKEGNAGPSFAIPINTIQKIVSLMTENNRTVLP